MAEDRNPQQLFIEYLKGFSKKNNTEPVPIEHAIPRWDGKDVPIAEAFYIKPVYLCAPHLNFPSITIPCDQLNCPGFYAGKGWAEERLLYGLSTSVYLLQYRYHCNNIHCQKSRSLECTETIIKTRRCPDFIRQQYANLYHTSHRAGATGELK
jgi:hypothetical protein